MACTQHHGLGRLFPHDDVATEEPEAPKDELATYLALPQKKFKNDWGVLDWWRDNEPLYPNLAVMARQYLGCPATSATVERLFSSVGIAFSNKRKRSKANTLAAMMFTHANVPGADLATLEDEDDDE